VQGQTDINQASPKHATSFILNSTVQCTIAALYNRPQTAYKPLVITRKITSLVLRSSNVWQYLCMIDQATWVVASLLAKPSC
jgi:hypothetical protein